MLALNLPLAIRSSDERTENTCKFWILATAMWLCEMVGLQNVWDPVTHALWWIGIFWLTAYQISLSTTEIDPEINFSHHLGHDVMRIAAILDMADALEVAHDTMALLLAPAIIAAAASNVIALISHCMRKTDPAAVERLEAARQMRMEQAAQTLAEDSQAQPSSHPSGKTAPAYSRHPNASAYQAVTSKDTFKLTTATRATKTFKDVVGMDALKARLLDAGKDIVESYTNRSVAVGEARNGILLVGTPGNGKTMFAEALAGELRLPMIYSSMGKIASRYLNQTTEQFMDLMASAALQAPCLLMIDEIDSVLSDRTNIDESTAGGKDSMVLVNAALEALITIRNRGVVVVGATNLFDKIDAAASRDGRFDFKIEVPNPDAPARKGILMHCMHDEYQRLAQRKAGQRHRLPTHQIVTPEDVLDHYIDRLNGFSAARMTGLAKEIASVMYKADSTTLAADFIEQALKNVQGSLCAVPGSAVRIEDLTMSEKIKAEMESLVARMTNAAALLKLGGTVPQGALFYGPARTGKTQGAMAIAKSANWNFVSTTGTDLLTDIKKIDQVFDKASENRPCVLFIDEAEQLLANRKQSHAAAFTNKLLTRMDGTKSNLTDIFVIAATNFREGLDEACMGGGRFSEKIQFELATKNQVLRVVQKWRTGLQIRIADNVTDEWITSTLADLAIGNVAHALQVTVTAVATRGLLKGSAVVQRQDMIDALKKMEI